MPEIRRDEPEAGVANQLDQVVERVELRRVLDALGQAADREEGAGDEEQRRDDQRGDVVELVDLLRCGGDGDPEGAVMKQKKGTRSIAQVGLRPKPIATSSGQQP